MPARPRLARRITLYALAYALLVGLVLILQGEALHENAEHTVWRAVLDGEWAQYEGRLHDEPDWRPVDPGQIRLFALDEAGTPTALVRLAPGLHDDVLLDGLPHAVSVRTLEGRRLALALDVSEFERFENAIARKVALVALLGALLLAIGAGTVAGVLTRPLRQLAEAIRTRRPDAPGPRIAVPEGASEEVWVIAEAVDGYVRALDQHVARERDFIDTASHELRTPVSVIAGAAGLALGQPGLPPAARAPLLRIQRTARGMEQLLALLLVLAKDPRRLAAADDRVALELLLPEIVDDHRPLCADKQLALALGPLPPVAVRAPLPIVQAAIGTLLRNAIEHSDRGEVRITLRPDAVVEIVDPGHGMSPEEIAALYARHARGEGRDGGGIGLALVARLCAHLGWRLAITAAGEGPGTRVTLDFAASHDFPTSPHAS